MKFIYKGNMGIAVEFEETDHDSEKRIIEQGIAVLKSIIKRIRDVEDKYPSKEV